MIKRIFLYINTIKYLRFRQIFHRLIRIIYVPKVYYSDSKKNPERSQLWKHILLYDEKIDVYFNSNFLNYPKKLDLPNDWNNSSMPMLWTYNMHYFEDLLSFNAKQKEIFHKNLLELWIVSNPKDSGPGWDPYPTSLRIINILKAWLGGLELSQEILRNVYHQSCYLSKSLEKHLLGNHYFINLKALLFAGVIYGNDDWISIAKKEIQDQINEQILNDGSHFELSPMYHSLILVDCLDILNLINSYKDKDLVDVETTLINVIPKMYDFLNAMSHPNGEVSFFNDSVEGIAPKKNIIKSYYKLLGFTREDKRSKTIQLIDNSSSGYFCATLGNSKLIFDAAEVGPKYIPGHAHADSLSFEMSIGNERVFVNSGVSQYEASNQRNIERKTKSHNTLEIDDKDSSEVWSAFRVANRANIIERSSKITNKDSIILKATHNGYKKIFGGCFHQRELVFEDSSLAVSDSILGKYSEAKSRFYFHPDLSVSLHDGILKVEGYNFKLKSNLKDHNSKIINSQWSPGFGLKQSNKMLEINLNSSNIKILFNWDLI